MRALSHPLRLKMLQLIDHEAGACVRTIYKELSIEQSVASQHLRILRMARLVWPERRGKFTFYNVDYERVQKSAETANRFVLGDEQQADQNSSPKRRERAPK